MNPLQNPMPTILGLLGTLLCGCVSIQAQAVDESEYLGQRNHPAGIYNTSVDPTFLSPLDGFFDPIDRLMLVDFEGDPDYNCLELQIMDNPQRGKGAVVLLYRTDGNVDLYHTPGLDLTGNIYRLISPGMSFVPTDISYGLEVTPQGTVGHAELKDVRGRTLEVFVRTARSDRPTRAMLAPLGDIVKSPQMFPFFFIQDFALAPRQGSEVRITIGGEKRQAATIPLWIDGTRFYLARYSFSPTIGIWNRAVTRDLQPFPDQGPYADGEKYEVHLREGHAEISRVTWSTVNHTMSFGFSPALPNLSAMRAGVSLSGRFSAGMDTTSGIFAGEYRVRRDGDQITMEIHPTKGWQPQLGKLWLTSYHWKAVIVLTHGHARMQSNWWRD